MDSILINTDGVLQIEVDAMPVVDLRLALKGRLSACLKTGETTLNTLDPKAWATYSNLTTRISRIRHLLSGLFKKPYSKEDIDALLQEYNV